MYAANLCHPVEALLQEKFMEWRAEEFELEETIQKDLAKDAPSRAILSCSVAPHYKTKSHVIVHPKPWQARRSWSGAD